MDGKISYQDWVCVEKQIEYIRDAARNLSGAMACEFPGAVGDGFVAVAEALEELGNIFNNAGLIEKETSK